MNIGVPEVLIVLVSAAVWLIPTLAALWIIRTIANISRVQEQILAKLDALEKRKGE